jgi:hypothetical protein
MAHPAAVNGKVDADHEPTLAGVVKFWVNGRQKIASIFSNPPIATKAPFVGRG